jgi:hypothetical protein
VLQWALTLVMLTALSRLHCAPQLAAAMADVIAAGQKRERLPNGVCLGRLQHHTTALHVQALWHTLLLLVQHLLLRLAEVSLHRCMGRGESKGRRSSYLRIQPQCGHVLRWRKHATQGPARYCRHAKLSLADNAWRCDLTIADASTAQHARRPNTDS